MQPRYFTIPRVVDREVFSRNFLRTLEPLTTPELRRFLDEAQGDNWGTEGEALIIALIEGQLAMREFQDQL